MAQTTTYYLAFIALGLTAASLGPTLLGLAGQTGSTLGEISLVFTVRSLGYLTGSFIGGRLFDRLPGHRTMALALVVIALTLASLPMVPLLWLLIAIMGVIGFCEALVDVGGNTLIVWVHREGVAPYMNGLHLFFAVGALLSPLLFAQVIALTGGFGPGYWLLALLMLPVILRLLPLANPKPIVEREQHASVRPNVLLLVMFVILFAIIAGSENSFAGLVYTYAVRMGAANEVTAAYLNAAFWAAFMLARVASIPIATRVRPRVIMIADLVIALAGILLILLMPSTPAALWGGTVLFGIGIASTFPTLLNFASRHMTITGAVTGWFFVGASLGSMTIPLLIGQTMDRIGPVSLLLVIAGAVSVGLVVFGAMLAHLRSEGGRV
jgi:MFS family permease